MFINIDFLDNRTPKYLNINYLAVSLKSCTIYKQPIIIIISK